MSKHDISFATLFKKYRLRSEIETLSEFGDLLAQEGIVYETSLFTKWQKGERIPKDRKVIINIIKIFIKQEGIRTIMEANNLMVSAGQGYLTKEEIYSISPTPSSLLGSFSLSFRDSSITPLVPRPNNTDLPSSKKLLKVFFAGSYKGSRLFKKTYVKKLYLEIAKLQYAHVDHDFLNVSYNSFIKSMSAGKNQLVFHYFKKMHSLYESDICVFETTYHSIGIGFLIEKAIEEQKPTIILYNQGHISLFISGVVNENIRVYEYNENNYREVVKNALSTASNIIKERYFLKD